MPFMNKRARKRVKEAVREELAERPGAGKGHGFNPPEKKQPASRGFTPRPDKKRG
jgi:hypothetical protein